MLWLDAGVGYGTVGNWQNRVNSAQYATQNNSSCQPQFATNGVNGLPVIHFDGVNDYVNVPNVMAGATQGEAFVVLKATSDVPATAYGLWNMGTSPDAAFYPHSDGNIYESFGSTTRQFLGNPTQRLDQYHLYNVASKTNDWTGWVNGLSLYHGSANTVGFPSAPTLGKNAGSGGPTYLAGDIAELLIYNRVLSAGEREAVGGYLNKRYSVMSVPAAPANLVAQGVSSNQVSVSWSGTDMNASYQLERKAGSNGTYAVVAVLPSALAYLDSGLAGGSGGSHPELNVVS